MAEGLSDPFVYLAEPPKECREKARHLNEIYSFDTDFDKIDGITRVEPAGEPTDILRS